MKPEKWMRNLEIPVHEVKIDIKCKDKNEDTKIYRNL